MSDKKDRIFTWHGNNESAIGSLEKYLNDIVVPDEPPNVDMDSLHRELKQLIYFEGQQLEILENPCGHYKRPAWFVNEWFARESKNKLIRDQLKKVRTKGRNKCDVCLSDITAEQVEARKKELESQIQPMDDLIAKEDKLKMTFKEETIQKVSNENSRLTLRKDVVVQKIKDAKDIKKTHTEWYTAFRDRARALGGLEEKKRLVCPYDCNDNLKRMKQNEERIAETLKQLKESQAKYFLYKDMTHHLGPNGIQSHLLEHTVNRLCTIVSSMTNMSGFRIHHNDKEKLIKTFNGHDISLMSGGELQRLKIASFLAYRHVLNEVMQWSSNLLMFDEPDTFVDASGVKDMMQMI